MFLIVKGAKWQARLEAEKRGIVWDEDDPNDPKPTNRDLGESVVYCAEKYRAQVVAWFCESPAVQRDGFPVGTVLYHN